MKKLSQAQFDALRYADGRQLYADSINNGNGNQRRTLLWLIDHGLLTWHPLYYGRVVLTDVGKQKLDEERKARRPQARRRQEKP
jgi:hypothetical protein